MATNSKIRSKLPKRKGRTFDFFGFNIPLKSSLGWQDELLSFMEENQPEPRSAQDNANIKLSDGMADLRETFKFGIRVLEFFTAGLPEEQQLTGDDIRDADLTMMEFIDKVGNLVIDQYKTLGLEPKTLEELVEEGKVNQTAEQTPVLTDSPNLK